MIFIYNCIYTESSVFSRSSVISAATARGHIPTCKLIKSWSCYTEKIGTKWWIHVQPMTSLEAVIMWALKDRRPMSKLCAVLHLIVVRMVVKDFFSQTPLSNALWLQLIGLYHQAKFTADCQSQQVLVCAYASWWWQYHTWTETRCNLWHQVPAQQTQTTYWCRFLECALI